MNSYHTQGAVPLNSNAYIERPFEQEVLQNILAGKWVLLLGPRQHGKTTGLMRVISQLREAGFACVLVDLQSMPLCREYEEIIRWFANHIKQTLGTIDSQSPSSKLLGKSAELIARVLGTASNAQETETYEAKQLDRLLERILPERQEPIVIVIDEASAISDPDWRNSFYGQIRSIANARAMANDENIAARVRFVFAGSFRPENLVHDLNSPFNVCERVETNDLTLEDTIALMKKVDDNGDEIIAKQAYDIVGGQPYLLQFIFSRVQLADEKEKQKALDEVIALLRGGQNDHFEGIFSRILAETELTKIVSILAKDGRIANEPAIPNYRYLQVLGLAKREGTYLLYLWVKKQEARPKNNQPELAHGLVTVGLWSQSRPGQNQSMKKLSV